MIDFCHFIAINSNVTDIWAINNTGMTSMGNIIVIDTNTVILQK